MSKRRNTFPVTGYVNASIEILSDSLRSAAMKERRFISDSLSSKIYREYVNPKDAVHTKRRLRSRKSMAFPILEGSGNTISKNFQILNLTRTSSWHTLENLMGKIKAANENRTGRRPH